MEHFSPCFSKEKFHESESVQTISVSKQNGNYIKESIVAGEARQ